MNNIPLVSVQCLVYNHEPYLRQCLDGFVMQQTTFEFEAIVHDDVSTDNSVLIIREYAEKYPNIIKPIYEKENKYSKRDGSLERIMNKACRGKYIAICEGDDYWIDPSKLQKQVDFLETHPNYGLVHTAAKSYIHTKECYGQNMGKVFGTVKELLLFNSIVTLTTCFRKEFLSDYYDKLPVSAFSWKMGDYPLWIYITFHSKIYFLNEITGVYRKLENSASNSNEISKNIAFCISVYDIQLWGCELCEIHDIYKLLKIKLYNALLYSYIKCNMPPDFKLLIEYLKLDFGKIFLIKFIVAKFSRGRSFLRKYFKISFS